MSLGDFRGAAKRIEDIDLPRIGHRIGVGEDEIHAVMDVEAAGSGFDSKGRPKMLFEPHIFWRELSGAKREQAAAAGLAYPKWRRNYPKDSYPRLKNAMAIDRDAALRSCSWGLGQIMGFNCKLAGYDSAEAMVRAFMDDEDKHLEAMIEFIKSTGLDDEIRRHDWTGFARGYNGAGYAKNRYHLKLASRYAWWQKRPDTPWSPGTVAAAQKTAAEIDAAETAIGRGDKGDAVSRLQYGLAAVGLYAGKVDGDFGPATEAAVRAFQKSAGLLVDGWVGPETLAALDVARAKRLDPDPVPAPPDVPAPPAKPAPQPDEPAAEPKPAAPTRNKVIAGLIGAIATAVAALAAYFKNGG